MSKCFQVALSSELVSDGDAHIPFDHHFQQKITVEGKKSRLHFEGQITFTSCFEIIPNLGQIIFYPHQM